MSEKIKFYLLFVYSLLLDLFSISVHFLKPTNSWGIHIFANINESGFCQKSPQKSIFLETHYYFTVTQILIVILIIMGCSRASEESVSVARARSSTRHRVR